MGEAQVIFLRLGVGFLGAVLLGVLCFFLARKKERDSVGWFFNGFIPGLVAGLIAAFACPAYVIWMVCGILAGLLVPGILLMLRPLEKKPEGGGKVRRPLRRFYLYLFLFIALLLIVFGFIGYYCVPDQPQLARLPAGVFAS